MTFLPIVERELRVASRRPATYWIRLAAAAAGLLVGGWIMLLPSVSSPETLSIHLFVSLSAGVFIYATFAGVRTTADCLSEEKREGTLGLLFLTDLKGYDVIFGKLVASSINVFYGVLAVFPVMAIPLLMGGVSVQEFWRVVLTVLNNLFFSLAAGMLASALCRDDRRAMGLCLLVVVFFVAALPALGFSLMAALRSPSPSPWLFIPSPGYAAVLSFDEPFQRSGFNYYYWSVLCTHVLGWFFLLLACVIVPRSWQDKARSARGEKRLSFWRALTQGSVAGRSTRRSRMLDVNPFYWLVSRDRLPMVATWVFLAAGGVCWAWGAWKKPSDWLSEGTYVSTALILHTVFKIWIASEAGRRLTIDRRNGALELLLSTPLSVSRIMAGQFLALRRQFGIPILLVLAVDVIFLWAGEQGGQGGKEWGWTWACAMIMLIADVITLPIVGMWTGLNARTSNRASGMVVARILVLPWILWFMLMSAVAFIGISTRSRFPDWLEHMPFLTWLLIGLGVNLFFGLSAWRRLHQRFRMVATQRYEARGSLFKRSAPSV